MWTGRNTRTPRVMKAARLMLACLLIVGLLLPQAALAQLADGSRQNSFAPVFAKPAVPAADQAGAKYRSGEIIFKTRGGSGESRILQKYNLKVLQRAGRLGYTLAAVPPNTDPEALLSRLRREDSISYAQPNFVYRLFGRPNDPQYARQWAMAKIRAEHGWGAVKNSGSVTVAILDSGIDINHPDLKDKLVPGINTVNPLKSTRDDAGHGTHVAGIAAAVTNNSLGVAGIAGIPGIKIMPVKVFGDEGATDITISDGIVWAADHGARVMNLSFGSFYRSQVLGEAIDYAYKKGVVMVAAAGNWSSEEVSYPAGLSKVMAVSATDKDNKIADFSSYGAQIDVCAPGKAIYSTYWDPYKGSTYNEESGTSMASPMVAGLAALMLAKNPKLSNEDVRQIIEASATELGDPGWDEFYGHGLINIQAALNFSLAKVNSANGTPQKARTLENGRTAKDRIDTGSQVDWYKIEVPEKNSLQVEVLPAGKVSPGVEIYDADEQLLASFNTGQSDGDRSYRSYDYMGETGGTLKVAEAVYGLVNNLDEGSYFVKVFGNHFRWSKEDYTITARVFIPEEVAKDSNEPNEDSTEAVSLEISAPVTGAITAEGDEDWFKMPLDSGKAYKIQVDVPHGIDLAVDVLSEAMVGEGFDSEDGFMDREMVWYDKTVNNSGQGEDEDGVIILPEKGRGNYYFRVYSVGRTSVNGAYKMTVNTFDVRRDKYESNESWNSGSTVVLGREVTANLDREDDVDWYQLDIAETGILTLEVQQPPDQWLDIKIYDDPKGDPEGIKSGWGYGNDSSYEDFFSGDDSTRTLHYKVTRGRYYLEISNYYGDVNPENYTFNTSFASFDFRDAEPNDNPLRPQRVQLGATVQGTVYPNGDIDVFAVTVEKPQSYLVYLTPPKDLDTAVLVFKENEPVPDGDDKKTDQSEGELEESPADDNQPEMPDVEVIAQIDSGQKGQPDAGVFTAGKPGTYYIAVTGLPDHEVKKSNTSSRGLYTINMKPFKVQPDAWEGNNTMAAARVITAGVAVRPTFMGTEDKDWYKINAPGAGSLYVSLEVPSDIDGVIEVYDQKGALLKRFDQSMVGEEETGSVALGRKGVYFIKTYDYMGNSSVQPYALKVTYQASPSGVKRK